MAGKFGNYLTQWGIPFSFLDSWKELLWLRRSLCFSEVNGDVRQIILKFSHHRIIAFTVKTVAFREEDA
jgi:hypothetical protein